MLNDKYQNLMKHIYDATSTQTDNHNLGKNVGIKNKYILRKIPLFQNFVG